MNINFDTGAKDLLSIDAVSDFFGYQANLISLQGVSTPNPETKEQFTKKQVKKWLRDIRQSYSVKSVVDTARATALSTFNGNDPEGS